MVRGKPQLMANISESATRSDEILIRVEINTLGFDIFSGVSTKVLHSFVPIVVGKLVSIDLLVISVDHDVSHIWHFI